MPEIPAEQVAFFYSASLESVTLVNALAAQDTRTDEDLTPFEASVAAGRPLLG